MYKNVIRPIMIALVALTVATASAVPARRGLWLTKTLTDGTAVKVQLLGDETLHYWEAANGTRYVGTADGALRPATTADLTAGAARRRSADEVRSMRRASARANARDYTGQKRGLIILAEFKNKSFKSGHDQVFFSRMCNEPGFTSDEGFVGSIYDYFLAQSGGQMDLTFDVVGPVQLAHDYSYYGKDKGMEGTDIRPGEMVVEACRAIQTQVNFKDYDWDNNGEVDQVVILFAGEGQADSGNADTIWPHEYMLRYSDYGRALFLNNMRINTYACVNEVRGSAFGGRIEGIGTLCHEFSHCLGLPDAYDSKYLNFGMNRWSLMDSGVYNGDGFRPAGYTAFEKMCVGWQEPIGLTTDIDISGMKPLSEHGDTYYILNDGNSNEYYLLEYREKSGWDAGLPGRGMLITHIDYDETVWVWNELNTTKDADSGNNHQRYTIFHADNAAGSQVRDLQHDTYPYGSCDSLTNKSLPRASVYNKNKDGSLLMNKGVYNIRFESDGTMAFDFRLADVQPYKPGDTKTLFYDSFNRCAGIGGNDNVFNGSTSIGQRPFLPDVTGWTYSSANGGNTCARFGSRNEAGTATTPSFDIPLDIEDNVLLTFMAAPWGNDSTQLRLSMEGNATVSPSELTMKNGQWTEFEAIINGTGTVRLTFTAAGRLFLDEVLVKTVSTAGISDAPRLNDKGQMINDKRSWVYDLQGRRLYPSSTLRSPSDALRRQKGVYIVNGRKYIQ